MYNLFVSGSEEAWRGGPWTIEASRCVNEYTDEAVIGQFGSLDAASVEALQKLPCIFAYEASNRQNPKFGVIRDVMKRQGQVRVEYEIIPVEPFLTHDDIDEMLFELDIGKWEMNRTHWAGKGVNLAKELHRRGIVLPNWTQSVSKAVDISTHHFDVALSFPGEARPLVEEVAGHLERLVGPNAYFYDNNYVSQLARPSLDTFLQDIYRNRAKLIVVFLRCRGGWVCSLIDTRYRLAWRHVTASYPEIDRARFSYPQAPLRISDRSPESLSDNCQTKSPAIAGGASRFSLTPDRARGDGLT